MTDQAGPRRRVVFLDHAPIVGGAQLTLIEHVAALDRSRFEPHIVLGTAVPELAQRYQAIGATVHPFEWTRLKHLSPLRAGRLVRQAVRLRRLVRDLDADLVVANTSRTAYTASISLAGCAVPLAWWIRDFEFGRGVFRVLQRAATKLICVSEAIRQFYGLCRDPRGAVVYVASAIHDRLAEVSDADRADARRAWGFTEHDVVVGYMGRLVEGKGPQDLVEAVARLAPEFPLLRLLVVGTGRNQEGDIEATLIADVARRGLDSIIQFAGYQSNEPLYYRMFDIFVLSSRYREAMPTSVIQAMMAGCPVVATATGGTPEVVIDEQTGLLVPAASPDAMTLALRRLLEDRDLCQRLAAGGRRHAMANHREDVATARIEAIYDALVS